MFLMNWINGTKAGPKSKKKKKKVVEVKQELVIDGRMFGFSKMGYGPKKTECQDSYCIMEKFNNNECLFFAVYDGHGSSGKEASQAANDYIQTYLEDHQHKIKGTNIGDIEHILLNAFKTAETKLGSSGIDYNNSGTCAIAVLIVKNMCYIANLGDSRAVMYRKTPKDRLAVELSYDHKPTRPDERIRIIKSGGKIERLSHDGQPVGPYRVWADDEGPGIAMTRTLGDLQAHKIGLLSVPEIQHLELTEKDYFIVIGSDGIWDVMNSGEVCGFVYHYRPRETVADALVAECRRRWDEMNKSKKNNSKIGDVPYLKFGCDDITAVVCYLCPNEDFNEDKGGLQNSHLDQSNI